MLLALMLDLTDPNSSGTISEMTRWFGYEGNFD